MRYAITRYNKHQRDVAYRIYVTDCLRIQVECATAMGGNRISPQRFAEIIFNKPSDDRTAEEVISTIKSKLK